MAVAAHTPSTHARSAQRESASLKLRRAWTRWLLAGPSEVLQVRSLTRSFGLDLAEQPADHPEDLLIGLQRWRARVQRRRAGVLLRRHLILAATLSIVLQALVVAGAIPQAALLAPLALLLVGVGIELARGPTLEDVAHLLDEQLGLFDRIGTGLGIQRHAGSTQRLLERRAVAEASGLTAASLGGSRASAVPAPREWSSLAVALVALAVVVLAGPSITSGSSTHKASTRTGAAGPGESAAASVRRSASTPKATGTGKKAVPPSSVHPKTAAEGHRGSSASPSAGYHTLKEAVQSRSTTSSGKGARSALGTGPAKTKPGAASEAARNSTSAQDIKGSIGVGSAAKPGTVSAVTAPSQKAGATAHATPNGATSKSGSSTPSSKSSSAPSSAAKQGTGAAGTPTGSATAGHQRASTQLGNSHAISGQVSHALPLQAEYAPARAGKTSGSSHSSKTGGGGGPGRSALVNGAGAASSSGAAGAFAYVPPDGGALPEGDGELLISYFNSLGRVKEQSW
jgi:hypothetical protein